MKEPEITTDEEAIRRVYESIKGVTEAERVPVKLNCS